MDNNETMEFVHFESLYPADSRFNEIKKVLVFIKEGKSVQIISLPGTGRSNLFGLLSFNRNIRLKHLGVNQKWFHFIYCNFSEIRKKPLFETEKFLFLSLIESLRERKMSPKPSKFAGEDVFEKANEIFKESISLNDELILFQGLKRAIDLLAIEKELNLVFLFDRFDEYVPVLTNNFFNNLRILRNRAKYRFSVVFSLNRPLEDSIEPSLFSDYYEFVAGNLVYLPLFDKPGFDFRASYLEKITGKKIDKNLIDDVLKLTGGHGKLTRLSLEAILASDKEVLNLKNSDFDIVSDFEIRISDLSSFLFSQKTIQSSLLEIWQTLTPSEQTFLKNVILNNQNVTLSETKSLKPSKILRFAQDDITKSFLENVGLIKNGKIQIPLFEKFISTMRQPARHASQGDAGGLFFDPNTFEIKKGNETLSDKLTLAEFKLLRFFLQNPGRIIERNEVINSVWQDLKTTQGVTDQAIDQLIFRLRRKIENDPNNPTHLQTVKGRGFKFNP